MKAAVGCVLVAVFFGAASAMGQSAASPADSSEASTNRIVLDVVVTKKSGGTPVAGLTQQDFTILNNGVAQPVTSFKALSGDDEPLEVTIVIDEVNDSFNTVAFERGQIDKFLRENSGRLQYPTALAFFSEKDTQIQRGFSRDGNALSADLDKQVVALRSIRRSAGFYGAAEQTTISVRTLNQLAALEGTRPGRKIVLWISAGWPLLTGPRVSIDQRQQRQIYSNVVRLSNTLRTAGVTLYNIDPLGAGDVGYQTYFYKNFVKGVSSPGQTDLADLSLQVQATQSGGLVLIGNNDVAAQLDEAIGDTKAYYAMSFEPAAGEPEEYHQIEVKVSKPGLAARTRTGYYSQP